MILLWESFSQSIYSYLTYRYPLYNEASILDLLAKLELIDIYILEFYSYRRGLFCYDPYRLLIIAINNNVLFRVKSNSFKDPNYILYLPTNV